MGRLRRTTKTSVPAAPVEVSSGEPWAGPHGIVLSADACAADLESETIVLDALSISGR